MASKRAGPLLKIFPAVGIMGREGAAMKENYNPTN